MLYAKTPIGINLTQEANQKRKYEEDNCSMYRIIKQSKYGNVKKIYNNRSYMSKKEAAYAQELDLRIKAHDIKSWKPQVKIDLQSNGYHICNYYIDFEITHNDDLIEFVEVKGFETEVWRLKWKLLESLYGRNPNYILTIVK